MILNLGGGGVGLAFLTDLLISIPYLELTKVSLQEIFAKFKKKTPTNTQTLGGDGLDPTGKCLNLFSKN